MNLKHFFPKWVHTIYMCYNTFGYDLKRILKYSFGYTNNVDGLKANLLMVLHSLEKGLTMPNGRCGFGKDKIFQINDLICKIVPTQPISYEIQYANELLEEYIEYHKKRKFQLPSEIEDAIVNAKNVINLPIYTNSNDYNNQSIFSENSFFIKEKASITEWAFSRHSCRTYIDKQIPKDVFIRVSEVANQAPSSCNRQSCRMHVITDKVHVSKVLEMQGGCRGFGHLAAAAIVVTSDLRSFYDVQERSQPAINSGFFGMNILYALHQEGIGACVLNWSNTRRKDFQLRKLVPTIKESEQIEFLISCGYPPENFCVALSKRRQVEDLICFV